MLKMNKNMNYYFKNFNLDDYCLDSFCAYEPRKSWHRPTFIGKGATGS